MSKSSCIRIFAEDTAQASDLQKALAAAGYQSETLSPSGKDLLFSLPSDAIVMEVALQGTPDSTETVEDSTGHTPVFPDSTVQPEAIEQLREQAALRKWLFEDAPVPIMMMDAGSLQFVECNRAAVEISGFSEPNELLGRSMTDLSAAGQDDGTPAAARVRKLIEQTQAEGQAVFEWRYRRPNGEVWDAEVHLTHSASGQRRLLQCTLLDISARRQMEWAIRERVKELTCLYNVGRALEDRRASAEAVCGAIVKELVPAMQFPHLAVPVLLLDGARYSTDRYDAHLSHCLYADIEVNGQARGRLSVFYTADEPFIIPEEQNLLANIARMVGLWIEEHEAVAAVHAAHRALEELNRDLERRVEERTTEVRRSELIYRALFENSNDAIFLMSLSGEDLLFNQKALDLLGYSAEEYRALPIGASIVPEQRADGYARLAAAARGEEVPLYERTLVGKHGKKVEVEINLSPVRDAGGQVIFVQSVVRDITGRKQAQEELRTSRDQLRIVNAALEKASRLKDEFLASMSHELRTPLTGILALAEALQLQTYGTLDERQRKALANIETSGRHLLELINDILDLSKIEAGKLEMHFAPCNVADACRASLQLVKGMAGRKQIKVSFTVASDSFIVNADVRRLKQMLVNLLSNAVKFTPETGQVGLEVRGDEHAQSVRFTVWDNGIGIQPEDIGKLFQPFVLLDSSLARQHSGTGLGLPLVRHMAELHGGRIEVESVPGKGSRFTIVLPRLVTVEPAVASSLALEATSPSAATPSDAAQRSAPLVMIADDNEQIREVLADYLVARGFRVIAATSGHELLEEVANVHPDIFLVDIQMPGMDGFEVIRRLRGHSDPGVQVTPILAVTALAMAGDRERCLAAGANDYLSKPIVLKQLLECVRECLNQGQS
jgi:PAS domain S-box-containing protein